MTTFMLDAAIAQSGASTQPKPATPATPAAPEPTLHAPFEPWSAEPAQRGGLVQRRMLAVGGTLAHPLLATWLGELGAPPDLAALQRALDDAQAGDGIARPRLQAQTRDLLADGLHYESRIAERGILATRAGTAHDAFNALVWLRHPVLKWAVNARQVADIARVGARTRTRGQCALTHFDEAGAIVWLSDAALLTLWDVHDWHGLFATQASAWGRSMAVTVFGHALVEHVWHGHDLPVAKAIAVRVPASVLAAATIGAGALLPSLPCGEAALAAAIADGRLLADPQELRPLPLAGIAGWHAGSAQADFIAAAPCFRPLRAGRCYPAAFALGAG